MSAVRRAGLALACTIGADAAYLATRSCLEHVPISSALALLVVSWPFLLLGWLLCLPVVLALSQPRGWRLMVFVTGCVLAGPLSASLFGLGGDLVYGGGWADVLYRWFRDPLLLGAKLGAVVPFAAVSTFVMLLYLLLLRYSAHGSIQPS